MLKFLRTADEKFSDAEAATPRRGGEWVGVEVCCVSEMRVPVN